jgi:hypothetical protein
VDLVQRLHDRPDRGRHVPEHEGRSERDQGRLVAPEDPRRREVDRVVDRLRHVRLHGRRDRVRPDVGEAERAEQAEAEQRERHERDERPERHCRREGQEPVPADRLYQLATEVECQPALLRCNRHQTPMPESACVQPATVA